MKLSGKITSLVIIFILFLSLMPSAVMAEEGNYRDAFLLVATTIIDGAENNDEEIVAEEVITQKESPEEITEEIPEENITLKEEPGTGYIYEAEEFIDFVLSMGPIGAEDEKAVYDAIGMYDSLSTLAKEMVKEAKMRLDMAVSIVSYLKSEEEKLIQSEERINAVIEDMKNISLVTKDDGHEVLGESIVSLEEKYALLDDMQKLILSERLMAQEMEEYEIFLGNVKNTHKQWQREYDEGIILPVYEKINSIEKLIFPQDTENFADLLVEISAEYDLLTPSQKSLLDEKTGGYDKLSAEYVNTLEAWQTAADINKLKGMLEEISAKEKITTKDAEIIYDALRAVEIAGRDVFAEELIFALENAATALEKEFAYEEKAKEIIALIGNIGEVDLSSADVIGLARDAYDMLSEGEKYYVNNLPVLTDAEKAYEYHVVSKEKADSVTTLIAGIEKAGFETEEAINLANAEYDSLDETAKGYVENVDKLKTLTSEMNDIKAAWEVDELILSVGEVDITKKEIIYSARDKYDELTDTQKTLVRNYDTLLTAEDILKDYVAARKVEKLIGKLPSHATFTKDVSIHEAKKAYDDLTDVQKELVPNAGKLMDVYEQMLLYEKRLEKYLEEYSEDTLHIDDETGYVTVTASLSDFLTDRDKDLIAKGKFVMYTVTVMSEEFTYEDVNVSLLPVEPEEVPFSPFYYIFISRSVAEMNESGVISEESETIIKEIPGQMMVEITISEDMLPPVTDITRIFTGLYSPSGNMTDFQRIIDMDSNMNTITFSVTGSASIVPSFIDIINPMTGDDGSFIPYMLFMVFAVLSLTIVMIRMRYRRN